MNFSTYTRDQLLELKVLVDEECSKIKAQLDRAKVGVKTRGEYADPDWFQRASAALKIKGRESQKIQLALSKLNRDVKAANIARAAVSVPTEHLRFLHAFWRATRFLVSEDEYTQLCVDARKAVEDEHPDAVACDQCGGTALGAQARG